MTASHFNRLRAISKKFTASDWPDILCPECGRGTLEMKKGSLVAEEGARSRSWHALDNWEVEWIYGPFSALLICDRSGCGDKVVVSGKFGVTEKVDEQGRWNGRDYEEVLEPEFFVPTLPLVRPNEKYPESVLDLVNQGGALLWVDPSSAANRVRAAIEELLTLHKIPRSHIGGGKRHYKNTHSRIELFKKQKPKFAEAADALMAVKWIGNSGSHGSELTVENVLDGVKLLDRALELIYDTSAREHTRMVTQINRRKGIPRKRAAAKGARA